MSEARRAIQTRHSTSPDRYPETFAEVARLVAAWEEPELRILSFGCSKGDECLTLAERYFTEPGHQIVGTDINPKILLWAMQNNAHERVSYVTSSHPRFAKMGQFDVIFAMAVLCAHTDSDTARTAPVALSFDRFSAICAELDERLSPGGMLVIANANYRFTDTPLSARYDAIADPTGRSGFVPVYGPRGEQIETGYPFTIFQKKADRA